MKTPFSKINNIISKLEKLDWDLNLAHKNGPSLHWYPCRYIPDIPSILIGNLSKKHSTILDPFSGCGTTIVEAIRLGRKGVGIDLNPVGLLSAKARLIRVPHSSEEYLINNYINRRFDSTKINPLMKSNYNYPELIHWYHRKTLMQLIIIYNLIDNEKRKKFYPILKSSFSAILNTVCSRREHFGWICDNVKPKELIYIDAIKAFKAKLIAYISSNKSFFKYIDLLNDQKVDISKDYELINGDAFDSIMKLNKNSVDLVVTSPPYYGVTDYINAFRLYSLWFPDDLLLSTKSSEIGARYKRKRKTAKLEYINDMSSVFTSIYPRLKKDHPMVLILGESKSRETYIDELNTRIEEIGFKNLKSIERRIPLKRQLKPSILKEQIIFYLKK